MQPTALLTETLNERQARVLTLEELKDKLEAIEGVQFKQFNSITDYHSLMFDLGVVARRLRSASDRSKYYRLIEASCTAVSQAPLPAPCATTCCRKTAACVRPSGYGSRAA